MGTFWPCVRPPTAPWPVPPVGTYVPPTSVNAPLLWRMTGMLPVSRTRPGFHVIPLYMLSVRAGSVKM
jgi:hypothetical protein